MRRSIALVLAAVLLLALTACGGSTLGLKRTVGESEHFSHGEIRAAMQTVERHFRRHFSGCTLLELTYDEEISDKEADEWAERYEAKEAIVLTSSFYVSPTGGDGSLNQDYTYTRWQWILTRSAIGGWKLQDWGY